jgi:hypothetical protein
MGAKSQNSSSTLTSARCCAVLLLGAVGLVVNCRLRSQLETSSTGGGSERGGVRAAAASDGHPYVVNKNSLAFRESYGFFDDLSDFDWALRREQARTHRHHIDPSAKVATEQTDVLMYYLKNYYPIFTCPHQRRVGGSGDGAKWTCDPWRLKYVARQPTRRQGANKKEGGGGMVLRGDNVVKDDGKCLIYSVGCRGNYVFEDGIVNLVGAGTCEIHVFDLTKDYTRPNDSTDKDIHFHYWGLASSYSNLGRNKKYTYMTLQETMQKLGHVNRTIDIFKIDCEHCTSTAMLLF